MISTRAPSSCPLCATPTSATVLAEAGWVDGATERRLQQAAPWWARRDGACPACIQQALLTLLIERGESVIGRVIQDVWPLDAEAAFGALPTPLRMRADPRFTGRGVTIAMVDAGFYPHCDLVTPVNRIRGWIDITQQQPAFRQFGPDERPEWPGWDARDAHQWHGLMTSATAAGNGARSHGLYRGLAPDADLVLVQARGVDGRIGSERIARALRWIHANRDAVGIDIVNVSLGSAVDDLHGNPVDEAVRALVAAGVLVVVAAGNDGVRSLVPPATAPEAVTVGGLDDHNVFDPTERAIWHSNYGESLAAKPKPDLVAPSIWVTAPILPGSAVADEALALFEARGSGDTSKASRLSDLRLVTPHYQHVEGTSFAAPIVSGIAACMLEANSGLTPQLLRELLERACQPIQGVEVERQGAGAVDAGRAVAHALAAGEFPSHSLPRSPRVEGRAVHFTLLHPRARDVRVAGSWDGWQRPGLHARQVRPGFWHVSILEVAPGDHQYKFAVDGVSWLPDPANPQRESDGFGSWNSVVVVP